MITRCYSQVIDTGIPLPDFSEDNYGTSDSDIADSASVSPSSILVLGSQTTRGPQVTITPQELVEIMNDPFSHGFEKVLILDARFDYEFRGGRIIGAINVRSKAQLIGIYERYLNQKVCIVFHCEFSHTRGPTLLQHFREYDRQNNTYPNLSYPYVYLLEGGYRRFYKEMPEYCSGGYTPMRDERYVNNGDLRKSHSFFEQEMLQHKKTRSRRALHRCNSQSVGHFSSFFDLASSLPGRLSCDDNDVSPFPFSASQGSF